jgi:hypothetical protein
MGQGDFDMLKSIVVIVALVSGLVGCAGSNFAKYIGAYAGVDLTFDYGHNFGDPDGGGITGNLEPAHGKHGGSSFSIDRADQYANDQVRAGFTILLRPE